VPFAAVEAGLQSLHMPTPSHLALTPDIEALRREFERLSADGDALVTPLSDAQFNWSPAPGVWSIALCVEHLNTVARLYLPRLDEGIADAIRRGLYAEGPFTYNWFGRTFVRIMEPPVRMKVKAPASFVPPPSRARGEIMAAFRAYQVQFIDRLRQSNGLDLARARVVSPTNRWVRLPLGSAFLLMAAHERRHLWQARRLTEAPGFPSA
jgi:hypothetical protein